MIDHLAYAVPDVAAAMDDLQRRLGVRPSVGGPHPGRGTHNALLDLGATAYLEVIGPDPAQPPPSQPRAFGIDALTAPRLATWAAKASDLRARVAAAKEAGYDAGRVMSLERRRPDGLLLQWEITRGAWPPAGEGLVPFLIDWAEAPHPSAAAAPGCTLVGLHGEHPQPAALCPLLGVLGVELEIVAAPRPALVATIDSPHGRVELR